MKIHTVIDSKEIAQMRQMLAIADHSRLVYSEVCYGTVILCQHSEGGESLVLERIPLLEFADMMDSFLRVSAKADSYTEDVADTNQRLGLTLSKKKKELSIESITRRDYVVTFTYREFKEEFHVWVRRLLKELVELCPEIKSYPPMVESQQQFGVW